MVISAAENILWVGTPDMSSIAVMTLIPFRTMFSFSLWPTYISRLVPVFTHNHKHQTCE